MNNVEKFKKIRDSIYQNNKQTKDDMEFKKRKLDIVNTLLPFMKDIKLEKPIIGMQVLALTDLAPIKRGKFIDEYWYNEHGFVERMDYDDGYGFITHWIDFETLNNLNIKL